MTVSLRKGQGVSLRKNEFDLSSVTIGLGWDINEEKRSSRRAFRQKEEEYDLDVIAFLCNNEGKVTDLGNVENGKPTLVNGDIVFFNSLRHKSGQIWLTGDNRTGAGDGDDEQIIAKLNSLDPKYEKLYSLFKSTTAKNYSSTSVKYRMHLSGRWMEEMSKWPGSTFQEAHPLPVSDRWSLQNSFGNQPAGN